jgi:hypothetical protein
MEFTKTTVVVWGNEAHPRNEIQSAARRAKLQEMEADGKTEATACVLVDEVTTKRFWKDQSAAEEWIAFTTDVAAANELTITSATIEDYVAPV